MSQRTPGFVYSEDLIRQANATEKWVAAEARKHRRANVGWRIYAGLVTINLILALGCLNYAIPGIRLVPVFYYQRADGAVETALTTDSLPADMTDANIQAWLWQYVLHRESYSWVEADYNHYLVEAMSAVPVRDAYDAWYSGKNPQSYLSVYGRRGVIRVALREVTEYQHATAAQPGRITIHFDRMVAVEGEGRVPPKMFSATVEFLQDYQRGFTWQDIKSFNPSRIVVTAYPGAQEMPASPSGITVP